MSDVKKTILDMKKSKPFIDFNNYHSNNILDIVNVSRKELVHSDFIAWMLNSHGSHGLDSFSAKQFIKCLKIVKEKKENIESRLDLDVINNFYNKDFIIDVKVQREIAVKTKRKKGRLDIIVFVYTKDKTLPILIENKVESDENNKQTTTYYKYGEKTFGNKDEFYEPIYIYLYPEYKKGNPSNKTYMRMTYQELVDYVIEPSYRKCKLEEAKNNIKTYLQCLSYSNENEKGKNIMAVSNEEREILNAFIKENEKLLYLVFDALKDDENKEAIEKMTKAVRDFTQYKFYNKIYGKGRLVLAVVKKYCEDNPKVSFDELRRKFPDNLMEKNWGVVRLGKDVIEQFQREKRKDKYERRYFTKDPITLADGNVVWVSNQWGEKRNIDRFIKHAKSLKYKIEEL